MDAKRDRQRGEMMGEATRRALGFATLATVMLAGCGGSQQPIGVAGAMPQSHAITTHAERGEPWMLPDAKNSNLLYVVTTNSIYVLAYPGYKNIQTLWKNRHAFGPITSDLNTGNVLINVGGVLYEYRHGGQKPIAQIKTLYGYSDAADYAFDPATSSIAVSEQKPSGGGVIAIYSTPSGNPTIYSVPNVAYPSYLGYDAMGDLFVQGRSSANGPWVFAELLKNASMFTDISLDKTLTYMGTVQWDGSYITIASANVVYQIEVSGSTGSVVGETTLDKGWQRRPAYWMQDGVVLGDHTSREHGGRYLGLWSYPLGGRAFKVLKNLSANKKEWIESEAVSIAPSR